MATPVLLIDALTQHGKEAKLTDVKICHLHTEVRASRTHRSSCLSYPIEADRLNAYYALFYPAHTHAWQGTAPYVEPDCQGIFHTTCFFVGPNMRKPVAEGRAEYVPIYLSEIPNLFRRKILPVDVALVQVSPPDRHGFCSLGRSMRLPLLRRGLCGMPPHLCVPNDTTTTPPHHTTGTSVDIMRAGVQCAKHVVGHINSRMPRTLGDGLVHISQFDRVFRCVSFSF